MSAPLTWKDYRSWLKDIFAQESEPKSSAPSPQNFSTDSRTITAGTWFVPIVGKKFDGHAYISEAMNQGAAGFFYNVSQRQAVSSSLLAKGVAVTDTLAAFQAVASGWRSTLKNIKLLALTGSSGKTTTKEMLSRILAAAGPSLSTEGSFNNEIGVPKTLLRLTPEMHYAALEFGARRPDDIRFLCHMVNPNVVGLLNVGSAHIGVFGSLEALIAAKLEIFHASSNQAVLIAPHDDQRLLEAAQATKKQIITFGYSKGSDVQLLNTSWHEHDGRMTVNMSIQGEPLSILLGIAHESAPINVAAACALAMAAGISPEAMAQGLNGFSGVKGRYQIHHYQDLTVIDDTYNANPDSMISGLVTLTKAFPSQGKVLVLGDMLELDDSSDEEHRRIGKFCAEKVCPTFLVTVGSQSSLIAKGAKGAGYPSEKIRSFSSVDDLLADKIDFKKFGSVLYAKGSRGIKLEQLINQLQNQMVQL